MKKLFAFILTLTMLATCVYAADVTAPVFSDVEANTLEADAIYKLAKAGIINGNGDGTFAPNRPVTRAELCKMVNNIWKFTEEDAAAFSDVTTDKWYYSHVKIGKKAGYINGFEDGTFRGDTYVTREQACAIVVRVANPYDLGISAGISDAVSPWAVNYVNIIVGNYLMTLEEGNTFRATQDMTRAELALLLSKFVTPPEDTSPNPDSGNNGNTDESTSSGVIIGGSSGSSGSSSKPSDNIDKKKQKELVEKLETLLDKLDEIKGYDWIIFTNEENAVLDIIEDTVNKTLKDADKGKKIYEEDYIQTKYKTEVEAVREAIDKMEQEGKLDAFKNKLKELPAYLIEYLAETMFGIDITEYV